MIYGPGDIYRRPQKRTWKTMSRWQRKQFHRDNAVRKTRGLKPLPKP